jgi:hypothetical protein
MMKLTYTMKRWKYTRIWHNFKPTAALLHNTGLYYGMADVNWLDFLLTDLEK